MTGLWGGGRRLAAVVFGLALAVPAAPATAASPPVGKLTPATNPALPPLELKDTKGRAHRLADYRGKVVLVNFWATWCEPCRAEMPSMQKLKDRMDKAGAPFVILAVNYSESSARVESFLQTMPLGFPVLLDAFSEVQRAWKPGILPASYLIDRDGRLRYRAVGEIDWAGDEAMAAIRTLLQ
ncbi:MAG: TlpA family protein disulfide reductase [Burkholderiales bacterium]